MKKRSKILVMGVAIATSFSTIAHAGDDHGHEGDFIVGRTGSGQLAVEFDSDKAFELPEVAFIPSDGFGLDDPGFMALDTDEPGEDFFTLAGSAEITVELVSRDADLQVLDDTVFTTLLANPSDQWALPLGNSFDVHPFWFVDDPDFSELGQTNSFSFKLVDLGGTYTDSPTYTADFINVPEPHSLALVLVGAAALIRRRS